MITIAGKNLEFARTVEQAQIYSGAEGANLRIIPASNTVNGWNPAWMSARVSVVVVDLQNNETMQ